MRSILGNSKDGLLDTFFESLEGLGNSKVDLLDNFLESLDIAWSIFYFVVNFNEEHLL